MKLSSDRVRGAKMEGEIKEGTIKERSRGAGRNYETEAAGMNRKEQGGAERK